MGVNKLLVLGSTGMAGHVITTFFEEKGTYEVVNLSHRKKLNEKFRLKMGILSMIGQRL